MPRYASLCSAILLFLARHRPSGKIRCSGKNVTGLWLGGRLWMLRNLPGYSSGRGIIWELTPEPGPRMISKADRDSILKGSWDKARDRGVTARMSETISGRERGGGESRKRMREPSLPKQTTPRIRLQEPASARMRRKANPTCNIGGTLSRALQHGENHRSGRSHRRSPKRASNLCGPPATDPQGQRKRRGLATLETVTEAPRQRCHYGNRGSGQGLRLGRTCQRNLRKSTTDATSGEQERRAKPNAVCPEPSQAKEKGKRPKTWERQNKKGVTSVTWTVDRKASRRESWRDHTRLPRAGEPGHPGSPGLTAQRATTARSAMHTGGETLPDKTYKRTVSSPARRWPRKTRKSMGSKWRPGSEIGKHRVSPTHSPTRGWAWPDRARLKRTR